MAATKAFHKKWVDTFNDPVFEDGFVNKVLLKYMKSTRWYAAKTQVAKSIKIQEAMPFEMDKGQTVFMLTIVIDFAAGFTEFYFLTIGFIPVGESIEQKAILHTTKLGDHEGHIVDALYTESFRKALYEQIISQKAMSNGQSKMVFDRGKALRSSPAYESSRVMDFDQSNTSVEFNGQYFFKIYRRLFIDPNPDLEMTKFLSEEGNFKNSPLYGGSITWIKSEIASISLGIMQEKVPNQGEAWNHTLELVKGYFDRLEATEANIDDIQDIPSFAFKSPDELTSSLKLLISDDAIAKVEKMAQRIGEMHIALFSNRIDTNFNPIAFNSDYTVWLKNRIIYQLNARFILVDECLPTLKGLAKEYAQLFADNRYEITNRFLAFEEARLNSCRIRIHGDLHLGQILMTEDDDFYIIDYEGEPESTIRDRKVKQTPLKDIAGMLRSFHYAVYAVIFDPKTKFKLSQEELFEAGEKYYRAISAIFLNKYISTAMSENLDIGYESEIRYLLKYHLLEKAVYEIGYELKARPDWAVIPLTGIKHILED